MLAMFWNRSGTYCRTGLVVGYGGTWRARPASQRGAPRPASHRWVTAAGGRWHTHTTTTGGGGGGGGGDRIDMWSPCDCHTNLTQTKKHVEAEEAKTVFAVFGTQKILEPKTTFQPLMGFRFHTP